MKVSKLLVLGTLLVALCMAVPSMAAEIAMAKNTVQHPGEVHPVDVYLIGQEVHYTLGITNTSNTQSMTIDIFDIEPGGSPTVQIEDDITLSPLEVWSSDYHYFVDAGDLVFLSGAWRIVNRLSAVGTQGEDFVDASVTKTSRVVRPAISVTKEADSDISKAGDTINYTITIENTGDWPLVNITVVDDVIGDLSGLFADTLAVGASDTQVVPYIVQGGDPDPLENEVTATGLAEGFGVDIVATQGPVVTDTAAESVDLVHPDFTVEKRCPSFSKPGDTVHYDVVITNTGDTALEILSVNDSVVGPLLACVGTVLAPGDFCPAAYDYVVQIGDPDPLVNTVTVTANVVGLPNILERDSNACETNLVHPDFTVEKVCLTDPVEGDTAEFQITITNTGDVDLIIETDEPELPGPVDLVQGQPIVLNVFRPVGDTDVINTINVIATLPAEFGLDNVIEKSATDTCTVQGNIFCSFTQGFWGNAGGKACDGTKTADLIDDLLGLGGPVVVGQAGHSITLSTSQCIIDLLPAGGTPAVLPAGDFSCPAPVAIPGSLLGKQGRFNNVLIGQVVTLTLNVRLGARPCLPGDETDGLLGLLELPDGPFCTVPWDNQDACAEEFEIPDALDHLTVDGLLIAANAALAGDPTYSLSDIYTAVTAINEGFDECRIIVPCIRREICDNGCDDDGDGLVDGDDPDCVL